jgi:DNA invertase Pin-like site-specific DNA recombinase
MERQTTADADSFCRQFGFALGKRILVDDGVSAWKGLNASPNHQLGQFLADARKGLVPRGDCLLLENYDRLSRQDPWAAIGLVSELRQLGVHIGRLDRMKLLRYDSTDPGDFFEASIEFMRGNSESNAKSDRNGKAWARKRKAARENGAIITHRLPAWVEERGGKLKLIPERAAIVKQIFSLSANGHGAALVVKTLTQNKVPAFGASARWTRAYVGLILKDRRVLGEFQPRRLDGSSDGPPLVNYYPPAISEAEFYAARAGAGSRRQKQGRIGNRVELFSGLLKNARDGDSYYVATRTDGGKHSRVLVNTNAAEGRAKCYSFPLATFEGSILSLLSEIDPHEILHVDSSPDESLALAGELAGVDAKISELEAELLRGDVTALANVLRRLEARKRELGEKLADARQKAAHSLSESWSETQTLLETLEKATDPQDVRLRLRAALKRIVHDIWLLVLPKGRDRLAAIQIWFHGGERHRDYVVWHRPARANKDSRKDGQWWAQSLAEVVRPGALDLRKRDHATRLEKALAEVKL